MLLLWLFTSENRIIGEKLRAWAAEVVVVEAIVPDHVRILDHLRFLDFRLNVPMRERKAGDDWLTSGGQEARWDNAQSGYVLTEPSKTFTAALLAPGATAHDELLNTTRPLEQSDELTVTLDDKSPQVLFARLTTGAEEGSEESSYTYSKQQAGKRK